MAQVWLLWWPKAGNSANTGTGIPATASNTTTSSTAAAGTGWLSCDQTADHSLSCCGLTKFIKKLKRRRRRLMLGGQRRLIASGRQSSSQCRYDPLSYSLNFDTRGNGSADSVDDEDYYQFYAFSSRFAANSTSSSSCSSVISK